MARMSSASSSPWEGLRIYPALDPVITGFDPPAYYKVTFERPVDFTTKGDCFTLNGQLLLFSADTLYQRWFRDYRVNAAFHLGAGLALILFFTAGRGQALREEGTGSGGALKGRGFFLILNCCFSFYGQA
jgi:hypothetical protein